jgi:hypothetical protein
MNQAIKLQTSCDEPEVKGLPQFYFYSLIPYEPPVREEEDS